MKLFAIIQARVGSTRLPNKVMKPLLNRPVLWHVVNRVAKARLVKGVFVATTTSPDDAVIEDFCKDNQIPVFRGSEDDVLDRYYQCALQNGIEHVVRITADCPLHDPEVIDFICAEYLTGGYDYVSNTFEYTFPDGLDVEVFSFTSLKAAWLEAELPSEREHVTPYIRKKAKFRTKNVCSTKDYPIYRLTVDCPDDYEFISRIYEGIGKEMFTLNETVDFLEKNRQLLDINQHHEINEGFLKSVEADRQYKRQHAEIDTERTSLRVLEEDDASQQYCNWLNDPIVNKFLETRSETIEGLKHFIRNKRESLSCLFLGIFAKDGDRHIGNVKLEPIEWEAKKAVLGILVGDKAYWGIGICTEVVKAVTEYAFDSLGLEEIGLGVISENKAAIQCYQKAGFEIERTELKTIKHGERFYDRVVMIRSKHSSGSVVVENE